VVKVKEDLTGQQFGRLTVLKQVEDHVYPSGKRRAQYLCECSCGNKKEVVVLGSHLKNGNTQSCGCLQKESNKNRKKDLLYQQFGRLTVIDYADDYISPSGKHYSKWVCECGCEKHSIIEVFGANLKNGTTKSCGCLKIENTKKANKKYNKFEFTNNYGVCYLNNGEHVLFDIEDYDLIKNFYWKLDSRGYVSTFDMKDGKSKCILMHRLIMNVSGNDKIEIDHIKHNKLDNRKSELRIVTKSQNMQNQSLNSSNTSGVKGVSFYKKTSKWRAYIQLNKKFIHLGLFVNFDDAVKARKNAENKYFGEFSYDNSMNIS
jgi:hypothetical protein